MKRQFSPQTSHGREPKARKYSDSNKRWRESSSEDSDDDIASQGNRHKKVKIEPFKRNTLLDELQSILHDYPDNEQIIKELIQNAEDAGASVVKVVCHPGGDVSHIKAPYKEYLSAVEKALKALLYQKDADLVLRTHDLSLLACRCGNDKLKSLVVEFEKVTKSYDAMRYPDGVTSGSVPSEFYTENEASVAILQADRILNMIKGVLEELKRS